MNVLLVYATNSGTTEVVAEFIADALTKAGNQTTVKEARVTKPEDLDGFPLVLFGSPSWDFNGMEGMPHEEFLPLMEKLRAKKFPGKQFAIFGLGDTSYKHFCGAVDHLEKLVSDIGGTLAIPSIRIDNYYADVDGFNGKILEWVGSIK
jgi:flavodoxin I